MSRMRVPTLVMAGSSATLAAVARLPMEEGPFGWKFTAAGPARGRRSGRY